MMARHTLRPPDMNPEGITPTEWVRRINSKGVGQVESITGDCALVDWLNGSKEVVQCVYLRRVRPGGEQFDRRGR